VASPLSLYHCHSECVDKRTEALLRCRFLFLTPTARTRAHMHTQVNQMLFDGLTVLQHRGQDAAGMVTAERSCRLHLRKDNGLVKDVFGSHHMLELRGHVGIAHCRYPTAGTSSCAEAQPLYTNYPYGICVAHNGNLTNTEELALKLQESAGRHVNTDSDSELLLNVFAEHLTQQHRRDSKPIEEAIFAAITQVMKECRGGYAGLYLINGFGLVAFRDPRGIRPLVFGCRKRSSSSPGSSSFSSTDEDGMPRTPAQMNDAEKKYDYVVSSESVAIDTLGFQLIRYVDRTLSSSAPLPIICVCYSCQLSAMSHSIHRFVFSSTDARTVMSRRAKPSLLTWKATAIRAFAMTKG
jgi:glutamine phosphoribosylpyrophosphate amidotransferase